MYDALRVAAIWFATAVVVAMLFGAWMRSRPHS